MSKQRFRVLTGEVAAPAGTKDGLLAEDDEDRARQREGESRPAPVLARVDGEEEDSEHNRLRKLLLAGDVASV